MFRPARMVHLSIVVLERDERRVLRELGKLGLVQLRRSDAGPDTAPFGPRDCTVELERCAALEQRIEAVLKALKVLPNLPGPQEGKELTLDQVEKRLRLIEERTGNLLKRREALLQRSRELSGLCEKLASYQGLEIPLDRVNEFSFLHFVTGTLPAGKLDALQQRIDANVALLPLPEVAGRHPLIAMTTVGGSPALEGLLKEAGFRHEPLPTGDGASADRLSQKSQEELNEQNAELGRVQQELRHLAQEAASSLGKSQRSVAIEKSLLEAGLNFPRTSAAVVITGWTPAANQEAVVRRLREISGGRCLVETGIPANLPEEDIPVLLQPSKLLRPFARLMAAYGLPKYLDLEPTLLVALSYTLMFGIMFGDVGQGAVLGLAGLVALLKGRARPVRDAGVLLVAGSLSSMAFGVIYGSCFGLPWYKPFALWRDPLAGNPLDWMYGAVAIGIVLISVGLILNIINRFRHKDLAGALLGRFGVLGLLFYSGALLLLTQYALIRSWGLVGPAILLFVVLPVIGWVADALLEWHSQRRASVPGSSAGSPLTAAVRALLEAFETILTFFANTVSFVRLAAYAMSHAAILMAAVVMAAELRHLSFGGGLLSVLVLVLGNLVAIFLEGIVAAVQALRLEYYEFFSKFFPGTGRPFKPFLFPAGPDTDNPGSFGTAHAPT